MFQNLVRAFEVAAEYVGRAVKDLVEQGRQEGWLPADRFTELPTAEWSRSAPVRRNRRYRLEESPDRTPALDHDVKSLRDTHHRRIRSPNGPDFHLFRRSHRYRAFLKAGPEKSGSGHERIGSSPPTAPLSSPQRAEERAPTKKSEPDRGVDQEGTPASALSSKTEGALEKGQGKTVAKTSLASPLTVGTILIQYNSPPRDRGTGLRGSPNRPQEKESPTSGPEDTEGGDGAAGQEPAASTSGNTGDRRHTRSVTRQSGVRPEYEGVGSASSGNEEEEESGDSDVDSGEDAPEAAVPAGLSDSSGDEHDAQEGEFTTGPTDPPIPSTSRATSPASSGSETVGYSCSVDTETASRASRQSIPTSVGEETETASNASKLSPPKSDVEVTSHLDLSIKGMRGHGEESSSGSADESTLPRLMGSRATDFLLSSLPLSLEVDLTGLMDSGSDLGQDSGFHVRERRPPGGQSNIVSGGPVGGAEEEMEVDTLPFFKTPKTSTPPAALGRPPTPPEDSIVDTGTTSAMEGVEEGAEEEMAEAEEGAPSVSSVSSVEGPGTPSPLTPVAVSPPGTPSSPQDRDPSPTGQHVSVGIQVSVSQPGDAASPIIIDSDEGDMGTPHPHGKPDPPATTSPEELLAYARRKSLQSREVALQHSRREEELRRELDRYTASSAQVSVSSLLTSHHLSLSWLVHIHRDPPPV